MGVFSGIMRVGTQAVSVVARQLRPASHPCASMWRGLSSRGQHFSEGEFEKIALETEARWALKNVGVSPSVKNIYEMAIYCVSTQKPQGGFNSWRELVEFFRVVIPDNSLRQSAEYYLQREQLRGFIERHDMKDNDSA
jgi:hypothetical protein